MRHPLATTKYQRKRILRSIVTILASIVVFVTTYALIIPAITWEKTLICELEEHVHTDNCYNSKGELKCGKTEHKHTDACYDAPKAVDPIYICGRTQHKHTEDCYFDDGTLKCTIPEHTHTSACLYANRIALTARTLLSSAPTPNPYCADPDTSDLISLFKVNGAFTADNDGKVTVDKTVSTITGSTDEFKVWLSALGQSYVNVTSVDRMVHPDVVFVVDISTSMARNQAGDSGVSRLAALQLALNNGIGQLLSQDKYDVKNSSDNEIGNKSVVAFVTGISLRKHPAGHGENDENILDGAKYIAYKTETDTTGEGKTKYYSYHEYTDTEYKALYDKVKDDYIQYYKETNKEDPDDADVNTYLADYMAKNPKCHTAWIEETGKVDPEDFTTFKNATILKADNKYQTVEIKNLTNDVFYLQEVEAPAGYKCPKVPYLVTVTPTEDMTSSQKHFTVTIDNQGKSELINVSSFKTENSNNFFTLHLEDGTATTLPSTGGAGTVALIAIGSLIFVSTGIVLVAKKRVYNEG